MHASKDIRIKDRIRDTGELFTTLKIPYVTTITYNDKDSMI